MATATLVTGKRVNQVPRRRPSGGRLLYAIRATVIVLMLFGTLAPLTWIFITAFVPNDAVTTLPVTIIPKEWTLDNVAQLFSPEGALPYIQNSLMATLGSTIAVIAIATPAAYAIARHRFFANAGGGFSLGILAARFVPGFMIVIPLFLMFRNLDLLDSIPGLIIVYTVMNLPLTVWVILPSARQLPPEIMEAAAVDGAGTWTTFFRISLPLLRPAIATAATLAMIFSWNEFFTALIFTQLRAQTAPILLSSFFSDASVQWGGLAATALAVALPMIVLGILAQRHLVRGLTAGSVK
ncbi:carbohydrate ABC transporter permease [Microbacterium trichothecenolyticum]|uniref:carbohydrate ABC transporter permease n=1 Tax=Microbacterium trichothecenolyticum TaxID=69370 RepID=UPI001C6E7865|nr:carbohydrate ABC transporter permease [Microbacterium trichothecenolyticum]MBW9122333.1 carbohydrate ABC transporter permease [Microbacterium trichothecenolyticum]